MQFIAHLIGYIAFGICLLLLGAVTLCAAYMVVNSLLGSVVDWLKTANVKETTPDHPRSPSRRI